MNKEILNNERYYGIDLFKFIMCIFVVTTVASIIIALLFILFKKYKKKKLLSLS